MMDNIEKAKVWDYILQQAILAHHNSAPGTDLGIDGGINVLLRTTFQKWEKRDDYSFEEFKLAADEMHNIKPSIGRIIESDYTYIFEPSDHILKLKELKYSFVEEINGIELDERIQKEMEDEKIKIDLENSKTQLLLNNWLLKTKWLPHIVALISIIISIVAMVISIKS